MTLTPETPMSTIISDTADRLQPYSQRWERHAQAVEGLYIDLADRVEFALKVLRDGQISDVEARRRVQAILIGFLTETRQ